MNAIEAESVEPVADVIALPSFRPVTILMHCVTAVDKPDGAIELELRVAGKNQRVLSHSAGELLRFFCVATDQIHPNWAWEMRQRINRCRRNGMESFKECSFLGSYRGARTRNGQGLIYIRVEAPDADEAHKIADGSFCTMYIEHNNEMYFDENGELLADG